MRACGDCQTCCTVAEVIEGQVNSPAGERCAHQCAAGCNIYLSRPTRCANYNCAWMRGVGLDHERPDLIGAMFYGGRTANGVLGFAIETAPDAIRTTARQMAIDFVTRLNMPLVVVSYGVKPPHDTGDRLILKREHVVRAFAMRGPLIERLSPHITLYEFARRAA